MSVSTILLALSLAATPPAGPSRLDPDDIEALEALLRAMDGIAEEQDASVDEDDAADETTDPSNDRTSRVEDQETTDEEAGEAGDGSGTHAPRAETAAGGEVAPRPVPTEARAAPLLRRMTPHVGMEQYQAVRGSGFGSALALNWRVTVAPLDDSGAPDADAAFEEGADTQSRTFFAGSSWAGERSDSGVWIYDFEASRIVRLDAAGSAYTNTSAFAAVRRNVDIYAALSRGGQAEEIAFGPQTSFHRFWLEAAMGVAAAPAGLTHTTRPADTEEGALSGGTVTSWYRGEDSPAIASAWTGCSGVELSPAGHRNLITAFAHRLAIHPDILTALRDGGEPVCGLSFTIISPESPQGRVEHWRLDGAEPLAFASLGFDRADLALPGQDLIRSSLRETIASALHGELGDPPSPPDFMVEMHALQNDGDYAGAMLTLVQETAHFGLCPAETIGSERLACAGAERLAEAGAGDPRFEAVSQATQAASESAHRLAVEQLLPYLDREGHAGAAARTMTARQLVEWGEEGLAAYPDLDPAALLAEALEMDPFAVNNYWYLAARYMAAGAPDEAWFLLDSGRALPGREPTDTLGQADALERRLHLLAPALFPGDAAQ
ncbi:hypothetical protein [Glycocaulis sp.]|uniref:hypothetical protein n=1 Tax=Glycocaulis sp. TaxID=1969725 RepID=UPI003F71AF8E